MRPFSPLVKRASNLMAVTVILAGCGPGGEYTPPKEPPAPPKPSSLCGPERPGPGGVSGLQGEFLALVQAGKSEEAFQKAFHEGDELFETEFTLEQGAGAKVRGTQRFTRIPRADLKGPGEWWTHKPDRPTGPNAQSCNACHNTPGDDGAGSTAVNVVRDPRRDGRAEQMIQRNTPHLFGAGALQLLAEEMTAELHAIRKAAADEACKTGRMVDPALVAKGEDFGRIKVTCSNNVPVFDTSKVKGVDPDLVVRPYQWKKSVIFMRDFARGAGHNELGMQAVELAGEGQDKDGDGISDELSYGDVTALTVYMSAQPRPATKTELADLAIIDVLKPGEREAIGRGEQVFGQIGCATCHKPQLTLDNPIFREPSQWEFYRDVVFCSGQIPEKVGVNWNYPITFDLSKDLPDNRIKKNGQELALGSFTEKDAQGRTIVRLYGDLKRHAMGSELAEAVDELGNGRQTVIQYAGGTVGSGASTFGTKELWGVACSGPWLHDGRATTLQEAIEYHGGEAAASRSAFDSLPAASQQDLIAFLQNLVLYKDGTDLEEWKKACKIGGD